MTTTTETGAAAVAEPATTAQAGPRAAEPAAPATERRPRTRATETRRPYRTGFCSAGNHAYCAGYAVNGPNAEQKVVPCACGCHHEQVHA